jgi:hypothetical protein
VDLSGGPSVDDGRRFNGGVVDVELGVVDFDGKPPTVR